MKKLNVAVFFGGCSPEYSVSLSSASGVILNLDTEKYNPLMIGITSSGSWYYYTGPVQKLLNDTWHNDQDCTPAVLSPNRGENCLLWLEDKSITRIPVFLWQAAARWPPPSAWIRTEPTGWSVSPESPFPDIWCWNPIRPLNRHQPLRKRLDILFTSSR